MDSVGSVGGIEIGELFISDSVESDEPKLSWDSDGSELENYWISDIEIDGIDNVSVGNSQDWLAVAYDHA